MARRPTLPPGNDRISMQSVRTAPSPIEGTGVFAARPFDRGDKILALDTSRVVSEANPLRPERGESEDHLAFLAAGTVVLLPEPERHLNHSCDPNAFLRTVGEDLPARFQREYLPLLEEWFVEKHSDEVAKLEAEARSIGGGDELMV